MRARHWIMRGCCKDSLAEYLSRDTHTTGVYLCQNEKCMKVLDVQGELVKAGRWHLW